MCHSPGKPKSNYLVNMASNAPETMTMRPGDKGWHPLHYNTFQTYGMLDSCFVYSLKIHLNIQTSLIGVYSHLTFSLGNSIPIHLAKDWATIIDFCFKTIQAFHFLPTKEK